MKPTAGMSAVRSGMLTGLSSLAVAGAAAGAGILLAHLFGRVRFRNCDQLDLVRSAPNLRRCVRDLLAHTLEIFSD